MLFQNIGPGSPCTASVVRFPQAIGSEEAVKVRRPWSVLPGQYVYLTLPSLGMRGLSLLQAHLYMIFWDEKHEDENHEA
jgi:hypothetical protein